MVLAGGQGGYIFAVAHDDEAGLFALQELLDHYPRSAFVVCHTQRVEVGVRASTGPQHEFNRLMRLMQAHRHHHTLACCQAVGLDNDGHAFLIDISMRGRRVGKCIVFGRGNTVALHERF